MTSAFTLAVELARSLLSASCRLLPAGYATTAPPRLAVAFDADNISPTLARAVIAQARLHGTVTVARAYGDWTRPSLSGWRQALLDHAVRPVQQFAYTNGKNATDAAMIIDVMDLLHTGLIDGLCLASSDSDFTPLALRIRETGRPVHGFGESKAPKPFTAACTTFTYLTPTKAASGGSPARARRIPDKAGAMIDASMTAVADADGWALLTALGAHLRRARPGFAQQTYGYRRLADLIAATRTVEFRHRKHPSGRGTTSWVRAVG